MLGCNRIVAIAVEVGGIVCCSERAVQCELCQDDASAHDGRRGCAVVVATDVGNLPLDWCTSLVDGFEISKRLGTDLRRDSLAAAHQCAGRNIVAECRWLLNLPVASGVLGRCVFQGKADMQTEALRGCNDRRRCCRVVAAQAKGK